MKKKAVTYIAVSTMILVLLACNAPSPSASPTKPLSTEVVLSSTQPATEQVAPPEVPSPTPTEIIMPFELSSTAFLQGDLIPNIYTCMDRDMSPPLTWGDPPVGTVSLALIMDDPDAPAGTWIHWIVYNISPSLRGLPEDTPRDLPPEQGQTGTTSWGRTGYDGPCPPSGTHRYFFKLYALDVTISQTAVTAAQLLQGMQGHILDQTELMGTFHK